MRNFFQRTVATLLIPAMTLGALPLSAQAGMVSTEQALVTGGIYRHTRNPLYVALALVYAGIAVAADSLWALMFLAPCLGVIRYGVIAREEAYLERKFGEEYRRFKSAVRRWL